MKSIKNFVTNFIILTAIITMASCKKDSNSSSSTPANNTGIASSDNGLHKGWIHKKQVYAKNEVPTQTFTDLVDGLDYCLSAITNLEPKPVLELGDRDYINELIDLVAEARLQAGPGADWQAALDSGILASIRAGRLDEAREGLRTCLSSSSG